jgi:ATP-binding cassette subfamily A (ABC1) protein 3
VGHAQGPLGKQGGRDHDAYVSLRTAEHVADDCADSMEEASALATRVVILSKRVLAVGTVSELEARYANYEVHFSARTRQDALRAREIMTRVPSARPIDDVATRFGVHIVSSRAHTSDEGVTLEELFGILAEAELEFAVERPMLESVFLKVIGEHNVEEEDEPRSRRSVWATMKRLV